jgi:TonB-dependent receptor
VNIRTKTKFKPAVLALVIAAAGATGFTQADGRVEGKLIAEGKGVGLQGGQVRLEELNLETLSERGGRFVFAGLKPGTYTLVVNYIGASSVRRTLIVEDEKTTLADVAISPLNAEIENIIVIGQAAGINKALNRQRTADNIVSAVSADAIGQFPDTNVSEALQRLPGLSIERDQGEGRYVRIRGLGPDFNAVTINGVSVPSPDNDRRAVALDVIPSDLLENLIVTKSLTPDMDANSLGGSIEVQSLSAFDRDGLFYQLSAAGSYDDNTEQTSPKVAVTASNLFSLGEGTDNLGIAGGVSFFKRDFGSDNVETGGAWEFDEETGLAEDARLEEIAQRDYRLTRERSGLSLNIDYKPSDNTHLYWRNLYSEYTDAEIRMANTIAFEDGLLADETGAAEIERELKDRTETQKILSTSFGGSTRLDTWVIDYRLAYSKSGEDEPVHLGAAIFVGEFDDIGFNDTRQPLLITAPEFFEAGNYELDEIELAQSSTNDTNSAINLDFTREFSMAANPAQLKFGVKHNARKKDSDSEVWILDDFDSSLADFIGSPIDYKLGDFGPSIDASAVGTFAQGFARDADNRDVEESNIGDFDITEDTSAAYLMGRIDIDSLRILTGVRYESIDFDATGYRLVDGDELTTTHFNNTQDHLLPALHIRYSLGEKTQLRAAWTNSVVRPNFGQLSPGFYRDDDEAEFGNPDLEPLESSNLDLGIEHYTGVASVVSAFVFYKDIENFSYQTDLAGTAGYTDFAEAVTFVNGDAAEIFGLELAASKQFDRLPSPWNGLLVGVNATFVESDASISNYDEDLEDFVARSVPLPSQSDTSANFMVGYESSRVSVRLSANYKSSYLLEVTEPLDAHYDVYVDAQTQLDFSLRYYVSDSVKIHLEALNLTDEPYYSYVNSKGFNSQYETYGPTYKLGITFTQF